MEVDENAEIIIIGSGQAGVPLAARLARAGRKVVVVERAALGGTCVNNGCTPTKTMIASARAAHVARTASTLGINVHGVQVDFPAVVARKDGVVARWRQGVERRLTSGGDNLRLVRGQARFVDTRTIEVAADGAVSRYRAHTVVVNVGARAVLPDIAGLDAARTLTSTSLIALRTLPQRLLIVGGGYIGCEMGQMFRRFGAEVTIVQSAQRLLPQEDPQVSRTLEEVFRTEGITLALGASAREVTYSGSELQLAVIPADTPAGAPPSGHVTGDDTTALFRASHLLVATGRRPNTDDLGCEVAGVKLDERGFIVVDERYQTSVEGVFAVGDCVPGPQFTHVSWDDHRVLFEILTGKATRPRSDRLVPYTVFTDPQVAGVGLSEAEARERHIAFEVAEMPFDQIARAVETGETAGLIKVLIDPSSERLLGARIVGAEAGELIHVFSALMQAKASARAMVDGEFVHPTFAEGLQSAVMKLPRFALS